MNATRYLYLNSRDEFLRINIRHLIYFEGEGNYTTFYTANGVKGTLAMTLAAMQNRLVESLGDEARSFARVGKRHIVNLEHIFSISMVRGLLTLSDGCGFSYNVPVAKEALRRLREIMVSKAVADASQVQK